MSSLFKHERKLNLCHAKAKFQNEYEGELESNQTYQVHFGFRVSNVNPFFSKIFSNSEQFKYQRKLKNDDSWHLLSFFHSTYFPPANMLLFAKDVDGNMKLAMIGSMIYPDPFKIILKRIVLTGYPIKAKNKRAIVRCMFYSPEDVKYFMKNEVYTKKGLKGKITESLGTHGLLKCVFNDVVRQSETVCMNLYKRVFPKFPVLLN